MTFTNYNRLIKAAFIENNGHTGIKTIYSYKLQLDSLFQPTKYKWDSAIDSKFHCMGRPQTFGDLYSSNSTSIGAVMMESVLNTLLTAIERQWNFTLFIIIPNMEVLIMLSTNQTDSWFWAFYLELVLISFFF